MLRIICGIAVALALSFCTPAKADITSINIGGSFNIPGDNWAMNHTWNVRALLLDSSHMPTGALSPPATFNTFGGLFTPTGFTVTLGNNEPAGTIFRIYRSMSPFAVGDAGIEYADYPGLCPCVAGSMFVPANGHLPNPDFANSGVTLPVRLQEYSAD